MLKKMILALLLATNGTVAFAAQQEEVVKQNEIEQVEQAEQTTSIDSTDNISTLTMVKTLTKRMTQNIKNVLHKYFIRKDKKRTIWNITAKACTIPSICLIAFACYATNNAIIKSIDKIYKSNKIDHDDILSICTITGLLASGVITLRELTNY